MFCDRLLEKHVLRFEEKKPERSSEILESCIAQVQTINKVTSERTVLHVTLGLSWTIPCLQTVIPGR